MANEENADQAECTDVKKEGGGGGCNAPVNGVAASEKAKELRASVAASGPVVFDAVKEHLVKEEVAKRTDLVLKCLVNKEELERESKKFKADPKTTG